MSLSINKLEKLLSNKGFLCKKFYEMDGMCVYIEILDLNSSDVFMLYIPSKYDIPISNRDNVYQVEYLEVDEDGNVARDYAGEPDKHDLEQVYDSSQIELDTDNGNGKDIRNFLEEKYDQPVHLRDMSVNDIKEIREVFRHLKRLRLAVKNLRYKVCIAFKHYLCCIRKDDTLEGFIVKKLQESSDRKLFVKLDIEALYDNINTLSVDIRTVREGIYSMLNRNQTRHMINLQKLVLNAGKVSVLSEAINTKRTRLADNLTKLESMMVRISESEKSARERLINARSSPGSSSTSFHSDLERTQMIARHETELTEIQRTKQEIIKNILGLKVKHENLLLRTDKILFDNIVMIDEVIRNITMMQNI